MIGNSNSKDRANGGAGSSRGDFLGSDFRGSRARERAFLWRLSLLVLSICLVGAMLFVGESEGQEGAGSDAKTSSPAGSAADDSKTADADTADSERDASIGSAAAGDDDHPESYLDFALAGGYLMIPVGICSLLWLTFLVERLVALRRSKILPSELVRTAESVAPGDATEEKLQQICQAHESSGARVLKAAGGKLDEPREEIEHAVNNAAQREIHSMRRSLRLFAVIAAVAPLIGLLGTVTGMIQAFREVAMQGLGSGKALAPGIYKALVTTAAGLIVAIPALLTHYWMMSRIDNYVHGMDRLVVDFVEKHRRRSEGSGLFAGSAVGSEPA